MTDSLYGTWQHFPPKAAEPVRPEPPVCRCGSSMSKNPHPDAGKPFTLLEVGPVWVCIPCGSRTLHAWCDRALEAEKKLNSIVAMASVKRP